MDDEEFDGLPFVAFSNEELDACPRVTVGDVITCDRCGEGHALRGSTDVHGEVTEDTTTPLLFYRCGDTMYLAAIRGALLFGNRLQSTEPAGGE